MLLLDIENTELYPIGKYILFTCIVVLLHNSTYDAVKCMQPATPMQAMLSWEKVPF